MLTINFLTHLLQKHCIQYVYMLHAKFLNYNIFCIINSGIIRSQLADLYIWKTRIFDYEHKYCFELLQKHCIQYMLQAKYLMYSTCQIVTNGLLSHQLADIYILKKRILDFNQTFLFKPFAKNTLYIVNVTIEISQVQYMLVSYIWVYS